MWFRGTLGYLFIVTLRLSTFCYKSADFWLLRKARHIFSAVFKSIKNLLISKISKSYASGLLRGVRWFETDVSGPPIGPNFKVKVKNSFILEYGSDR